MESQSIFEKPMMKWGLFLGGVNVAYILVFYLIDVSLLISFWNTLISLVLLVTFMVLGCRDAREQNQGSLPYGSAVLTALVIGVVSTIVGVLFNSLLYNVIDPSLPETMKALSIEKTAGMLERFGASEESIEQALENMDQREFKQDFRSSVTAVLIASVFSGLIALIVGAFMKRNPPLFEEEV
ncbi:MAG: DUF4199 domain-containing protein [Bacteroidia bacterium]|jgi:hypothetical protein